MCCRNERKGCQKPENLKGKPEDCSSELVRKCHGDLKKHPCTTGKAKQRTPPAMDNQRAGISPRAAGSPSKRTVVS